MSRPITPDDIRAAQLMRADGKTWREVAEALDTTVGRISAAVSDASHPDRAAARRRRYLERHNLIGTCVDCGKETQAARAGDRAPERCMPCTSAARAARTRRWIIESIQTWHAERGETPSAYEWLTDQMRRRAGAEDVPCTTTVLKHFGSWNNAIAAAGFEPRGSGVKKSDLRSAA